MTDSSQNVDSGPEGGGAPIGAVLFAPDSPLFAGAHHSSAAGPTWMPAQYSSSREEFLAARTTASLGFVLNISPVYDVVGPDAVAFLNSVAVNKDFTVFPEGSSKHVLICNDDGHLLADGVAVKIGENHFRTYWLAPVLDFHLRKSPLDVQGEYITNEYFFQIDGPKSLEIMERVTGTDLHDLSFARNKRVPLAGGEATVHRLGMSGALAYEVHGDSAHARDAYEAIREVLEEFGGKRQGWWNYSTVNHTVGGYPNQYIHFLYPYDDSGAELSEFMASAPHLDMDPYGSAAGDRSNLYVTPYDIGWGYLVNFDHEFPGKAALQRLAEERPRRVVTLEWNAEDIGEIFAAQFRGDEAVLYDSIDPSNPEDRVARRIRGDLVLLDGKVVGVASGRTTAYFERRMVSLAFVDREIAEEGREVTVLWGEEGHPQFEIRATIARFPYYNGEFRNEKFDTSVIPRLAGVSSDA